MGQIFFSGFLTSKEPKLIPCLRESLSLFDNKKSLLTDGLFEQIVDRNITKNIGFLGLLKKLRVQM